jgi:hypothetical protein
MTTIRLPGVKSYKSNGQVYYYMRRTGARIVDPATGCANRPGHGLGSVRRAARGDENCLGSRTKATKA